jgi:hypothetical protein
MIEYVRVTVDDVDYELPQEITVTHYGELMRRMSLSETEIEKAHDVICVMLGIPYTIIREFEKQKMAELSIYIQNRISECDIPYEPTFKWKGTEYGGLIMNKMSFGEYIDIVSFVNDQNSIYMNIHKLCAILYRPIINKTKEKYTIKEYNLDDHEELSEIFRDLPLKYFFGVFKNLFTYLKQMRKEFEVLFGEEEDEIKKPEDDDKKEEEKTNLPWYKMIMTLSADDFTKIDYVTSRPVVECFNHLTYIKLKNEDQKLRLLEQQNKLNLL